MTFALIDRLRVIESSAFIAAPLAGLTLAQYGADVIRIDMIGGGIDYQRAPLMPGGRSLYWTGLNKGKRSVAVDIRRPEGRELVRALVTASGDAGGVLLTNIVSPWLAHESLAALRPDLISCTIRGNPDGSTAVDYTVNAAAGFPFMTGSARPDAPVNNVLPAWDIACANQAAFALLAAVMRRRATGQGAELRLSLADVAFTTLSHLGYMAEAELLNQDRPPIGNHIYGAFGRDFGTRDGQRIMVAGISAAQWAALCKVCALDAGFAAMNEEQRFAARERIAVAVAAWCAARDLADIATAFDAAKVCWGRYRTVTDLVANDERVSTANPVFQMLDTPGIGAHRGAAAAVSVGDLTRAPASPAPWLGQHTEQVLAAVLGLSSGAMGKLFDQGIVAGPERDPFYKPSASQPS